MVASTVGSRDGLGLELLLPGSRSEVVAEVFRDDDANEVFVQTFDGYQVPFEVMKWLMDEAGPALWE